MSTLTLPLKAVFFNEIKSGIKTKEYRLVTPYWRKRLEGRVYDGIVLTLGYPSADDADRRLSRPWRGFTVETIQHDHFGPSPVRVFAIDVAPEQSNG